MSGTAVAFESPMTGERVEVEVPLGCRLDLVDLRADLGLPEYVDVSEPHVGRGVAVIWAARRAPELAREHPRLQQLDRPLRVAVFGGVGFRFLSPSANRPPLARSLGDLDLIAPKADAPKLVGLLTALHEVLGSRFWHGVSKSDEMFNNLRGGQRYRVRAVEEDPGSPSGIAGTSLDILVDRIRFCHEIPVESALDEPERYLNTVGGVELLLTKLQYIRAMRRDEIPHEHEYRIIGELGKQALIGPEDKDILDCVCLLADREIGPGAAGLDPDVLERRLTADWGLARTVRLNVENTRAFEHVLDQRNVEASLREHVLRGLSELRVVVSEAADRARAPRLRLNRRWWEEVEDQ